MHIARYLTNVAMKSAAESCHALGMRFAVYNTMRELSDRCMEYPAMVSFNETFVPGTGGGADWLQEHLRDGYVNSSSLALCCLTSTPIASCNSSNGFRREPKC